MIHVNVDRARLGAGRVFNPHAAPKILWDIGATINFVGGVEQRHGKRCVVAPKAEVGAKSGPIDYYLLWRHAENGQPWCDEPRPNSRRLSPTRYKHTGCCVNPCPWIPPLGSTTSCAPTPVWRGTDRRLVRAGALRNCCRIARDAPRMEASLVAGARPLTTFPDRHNFLLPRRCIAGKNQLVAAMRLRIILRLPFLQLEMAFVRKEICKKLPEQKQNDAGMNQMDPDFLPPPFKSFDECARQVCQQRVADEIASRKDRHHEVPVEKAQFLPVDEEAPEPHFLCAPQSLVHLRERSEENQKDGQREKRDGESQLEVKSSRPGCSWLRFDEFDERHVLRPRPRHPQATCRKPLVTSRTIAPSNRFIVYEVDENGSGSRRIEGVINGARSLSQCPRGRLFAPAVHVEQRCRPVSLGKCLLSHRPWRPPAQGR